MPQMAPLSWLSLFIIFSITLIIFNTLNYFSYPSHKTSLLSKSNYSSNHYLNWKW